MFDGLGESDLLEGVDNCRLVSISFACPEGNSARGMRTVASCGVDYVTHQLHCFQQTTGWSGSQVT